MHELEELLFEESPLRPSKKTDTRARTNDSTMKDLLEMDTMFLSYDYTKQNSNTTTTNRELIEDNTHTNNIPASLSASSSSITAPTMIDTILSSPTPGSLLRRVGGALNEKLEQTKYNSQGYYELAANENANIPNSYTTNTTAACIPEASSNSTNKKK